MIDELLDEDADTTARDGRKATVKNKSDGDDDDDDDGVTDDNDTNDDDDDAISQAAVNAHKAAGARARHPIVVTDDEAAVATHAVTALALRGAVFQSTGQLVMPTFDPNNKQWNMRALTVASVRHQLSEAAVFFSSRVKKGKRKRVHVPVWLPGMVHGLGYWHNVPVLRGISSTPIMRSNGTVFDKSGYDKETQLAHGPTCKYPPISLTTPTLEDAKGAAAEILLMFCDFPFKDECDKAATLALILTIIVRHLINGPVPAFPVDANVPGTGKGLLIETAVAIALGTQVAIMTQTDDDAEDRKRITSCLRAGDRVLAFDNVTTFGGPLWDALITSTKWRDRALSKNEMLTLDMRAVVTATANGARILGDTARRVIPIRLHTDDPKPELRTNFVRTLPRDALKDHPRLFMLALDVLRYGLSLPDSAGPQGSFGSFEAWCKIVRRTVAAVLVDPLGTRVNVEVDDEGLNALRAFLTTVYGLGAGQEWSCTDLVAESRSKRDHEGKIMKEGNAALAEALASIAGDAERVSANVLGAQLRRHVGRVVEFDNGDKLRLERRSEHGRNFWRVECDATTKTATPTNPPPPSEGEPDFVGPTGQGSSPPSG